MSWFERIFRRRRLDDELSEEVREHLQEKTEQLMRLEHLSHAEARQAALRAFGNRTLVETRSREVWGWPRLESILADLRLALRRLIKAPGFAATVLLTSWRRSPSNATSNNCPVSDFRESGALNPE